MWIHLLSLELIDGASPAGTVAATTTTATAAGVRRARFLRRAPKLPWEDEEEEQPITIAPPKRKRIPLPTAKVLKSEIGPIPIQTVKEIQAPVITIPELGAARLKEIEEDDEDWLWLI